MSAWFFASWVVHGSVVLLHRILPAREVDGYVHEGGRPLRYRLNGPLVLVVVVAAWALLGYAGVVPWDGLYVHGAESFAGAVVLGLLFTAAVVLPAPPTGRGWLADLYLGRRENPQWRGIDAKMALYLVGAVLLELHLLSACAHRWPDPGLIPYTALFSFFVVEYLWFERVHLYTYDFVAERTGFKLGWGCIAFYPYFYAVGAWAEAERAVWTPWVPGAAIVFFWGWVLARGANLQKYRFKTEPGRPFLGITPEALDGRVLVNGFWGVSRHVNYLGELAMAVGLTLSLGRPLDPWPWAYPLYYLVLLVPRQLDDDRRCAAKYGPLWDEYRRRVPARIVPGVY